MGKWMRQFHRYLSVVFTLAVLANFVAMAVAPEATWVGFLAVPPLLLMLITGLYLFAQPYLAKRRARVA